MTRRTGLLLALLAASMLFAARFAPDVKFLELSDFSGGLYTSRKPHKIPENYASYMNNVVIDATDGTIKKPNGFDSLGSTPTISSVRLFAIYNRSDGVTEFIVSDSSIVLTTQDFNTFTKIRGALNSSVNLQAKQVYDKMWFTNGSDSVFTWDGSSVVVLDGTTYGGLATPVVPKGRFIEFDQDRVWMANLPSNKSMVQYSAVVDTASNIIAPDNFLAWPSNLQINIGKGDGTDITFAQSFRGSVRIGKTLSIYTIMGANGTYIPVKTSAGIGFISEHPVELDNLLYGQGIDGFYSFDGESTQRLSDLITDDFRTIRNDTTRIVSNTWDTKAQFDSGGTYNGSTVTADGFLQVMTTASANNNPFTALNDKDAPTCASNQEYKFYGTNLSLNYPVANATSTPWVALTTQSINTNNNYTGFLYQIGFDVDGGEDASCATGCGTNEVDLTIHVRNIRTNQYITANKIIPNFNQRNDWATEIGGYPVIFGSTFPILISDVLGSSIEVKIEISTANAVTTCNVSISSLTALGLGDFLIANTSGNYLSQITTISTINSWNLFNAVKTDNGGSVQYYIRTATSAVNIATYAWVPISPGAIITASSTNNYFQWAATMTALSTITTPNTDSVEVQHIEGSGSNTRSFGIAWDNRWWIGVSTESTGNFPVIYWKSKITNKVPNAFMPMRGMNMRCLARTATSLYGGGASTGVFYRMDYGDSFDGAAIDSIYDTPEFVLSGDFVDKKLMEYLIDTQAENGNTLQIGTSIDGGDFSYSTLDLSGSGRLRKHVYNVDKDGKSFKFRFRNNQAGKGLQIHKFGAGYTSVPLQ